jgi:uncharacterized membrane protein YesL
MKRISHNTYATVFGVVYLGLMTNALLLIGCLPLVVLLVTTDPATSWPLLAVAAPMCAPSVAAAFTVFREHSRGGTQVARAFLAAWRAVWRKALALGAMASALLVVALVDVRAVAHLEISVVVVPLLAVIALVTLAVTVIGLAAVAEEPDARLRDVLKASLYLGVRRWYLTVVSLLVLATQLMLFTSMPAIALGLTAAPALYLAWANSRYTLRPVLATEELTA